MKERKKGIPRSETRFQDTRSNHSYHDENCASYPHHASAYHPGIKLKSLQRKWSFPLRISSVNVTKYAGEWISLFNKVVGLMKLWHRCFPVNFVKFLRTPFLQNTSGRLLFFCFVSVEFHENTFPFCRLNQGILSNII